jgi:hypothetical protein
LDKLPQRNVVKFVKNLLGDNEIKAVLQRLDRLTQDEGRTTAVQTLEVVHGLAQDVRVVMDGEQSYLAIHSRVVKYPVLKTAEHWQRVPERP